MKTSALLCLLVSMNAVLLADEHKNDAYRRTNVILINADDLGYGDPSCYGGKLSDNGPANPVHLSIPSWWPEGSPYHLLGQRGPLSGFKGNFCEAGIRVPYIISCPGHLEQGLEYSEPVSTLDLYPTLCSAAHVKIPDNTHLDGVNLMPHLLGDNREGPGRTLFWYANRMGAARVGKWKFLVEDNQHYLFDLESDLEETRNVMHQNQDVMKQLLGAYINHRNEMPPYRNPYVRPIDIPSAEAIDLPVLDPQ